MTVVVRVRNVKSDERYVCACLYAATGSESASEAKVHTVYELIDPDDGGTVARRGVRPGGYCRLRRCGARRPG